MKIEFDHDEHKKAIEQRLADRDSGEQQYRKILNNTKTQTINGTVKNKYLRDNYAMENRDYFFTEFKNLEIGARVALSEEDYFVVSGLRINYCTFESCQIQNIRFENCSFAGCKFNKSFLNKAVFKNCLFSLPLIEDGRVNLDDIRNVPAVFINCSIIARFDDCDLDHAYLDKTRIILSSFTRCKLKQAFLDSCAISGMTIKDCDMQGIVIRKADIMEISITDELGSTLNEESYFDPSVYVKKAKKGKELRTDCNALVANYSEMLGVKAKSLRAISGLFEVNGYSSISGEYYYQSKLVEKGSLKFASKVLSHCAHALCGYGERPINTFACIVISILVFAIIYVFSGFKMGEEMININNVINLWPNVSKIIKLFGHSLFFSITTFSTVGYGNYVPVGSISLIVAGIQMLVGVSLTALWTGCIFRKITR